MGKKPVIVTNEYLMSQWNYRRNEALKYYPETITIGSGKKVWWICEEKHEWQASPYSREHLKSGCPVCSGHLVKPGINDLASQMPELLTDWNYEKNEINPNEIYMGSAKRAWWLCHICGNEWDSLISNRSVNHHGCPRCAAINRGINRTKISTNNGMNSILKVRPDLMEEWNYALNQGFDPSSLPPNYNKKVWWKCALCGHQWQATPNKRSQGRGCPKCKSALHTSLPEQVIFFYLKKIFPETINSYYPNYLSGKEIDIYIPSLNMAIEYDGRAWHQNVDRDLKKSKLIVENGTSLVRLRENGCPDLGLDNIMTIQVESADKASAGLLLQPIKELFEYISGKIGKEISLEINIDDDIPLILKNFNDSVKENSLEARYPEIANEWNVKKNKGLLPSHVFPRASRKVWWQCPKCDYEWNATISSRAAGNGCPVCSNRIVWEGHNDLASIMPELLSEWDYEKNTVIPSEVVAGSCKKVWWKCSKCGSSWEANISSRTRQGTGCPVCAGKRIVKGINDLETIYPQIAKEWNYEKTSCLNPSEVGSGSHKKVWWKCSVCNFEWDTTVHNRVSGSGCPKCAKISRAKVASLQNLIVGVNDLETLFPNLLLEWMYEKNIPLRPNSVSCGSSKKYGGNVVNVVIYGRRV